MVEITNTIKAAIHGLPITSLAQLVDAGNGPIVLRFESDLWNALALNGGMSLIL